MCEWRQRGNQTERLLRLLHGSPTEASLSVSEAGQLAWANTRPLWFSALLFLNLLARRCITSPLRQTQTKKYIYIYHSLVVTCVAQTKVSSHIAWKLSGYLRVNCNKSFYLNNHIGCLSLILDTTHRSVPPAGASDLRCHGKNKTTHRTLQMRLRLGYGHCSVRFRHKKNLVRLRKRS